MEIFYSVSFTSHIVLLCGFSANIRTSTSHTNCLGCHLSFRPFVVQLPDSSMWLVKTLVCWFCPAESGKLSKVFFLRPCSCFVLGFVTHESESRTENMLQCNWRFSNFLLSLSLSLRTPHSWISVQLWWNQFLRLLKKLVHLNKFEEEKTEKDKRGYRHILPIQLA